MWQVIALDTSGRERTYSIDAPEDAAQYEVTDAAYGMHGRKLRDGEEALPLRPGCTVKWISGE